MTAATMLSRVRTLLDESSAGYWTDNEIYAALADGQNEVINILLTRYKSTGNLPKPLTYIIKDYYDATVTSDGYEIEDDVLEIMNVMYAAQTDGTTEYPAVIKEYSYGVEENEDNGYLSATYTRPICYIKGQISSPYPRLLIVKPDPDDTNKGVVRMSVVYRPENIASGKEPTLPEETHNAIVHYAVFDLLMKEERAEEAMVQNKKFTELVSVI